MEKVPRTQAIYEQMSPEDVKHELLNAQSYRSQAVASFLYVVGWLPADYVAHNIRNSREKLTFDDWLWIGHCETIKTVTHALMIMIDPDQYNTCLERSEDVPLHDRVDNV